MVGIFVHNLIAGKIRTKNPIYLLLLAVLGLLCISPFLLAILEPFQGDLLPLGAWGIIAIPGLIGMAMLVNLFKNLFRIRGN